MFSNETKRSRNEEKSQRGENEFASLLIRFSNSFVKEQSNFFYHTRWDTSNANFCLPVSHLSQNSRMITDNEETDGAFCKSGENLWKWEPNYIIDKLDFPFPFYFESKKSLVCQMQIKTVHKILICRPSRPWKVFKSMAAEVGEGSSPAMRWEWKFD